MDPNEERLKNMEAQLRYLTESAQKLTNMVYDLGTALQNMHKQHMKELKACQEAYLQNLEAHQGLEDAVMDSIDSMSTDCNPWG